MRTRGLDEDGVARAVRLYGQGLSVAAVGEQLNVDGKTVWAALRREGAQLRSGTTPTSR